jgi:flagellar biosynthesis chaperone FliJ
MNRRRMASVLRVRQIQERSARGELAMTRRRLRSAEEAEQTTWRLLDERVASVHLARPVPAVLADRIAVEAGMLAADTQRTVIVRSVVDVQAAMEHWTVAARRVEGLERLAERSRVIELEEEGRRTANEIDDLVLVRFAEKVAS